MDPISIASTVAQATGICLSITKKLYDLREKYKETPVVIVAICSESTVLSASLAQIQSLLLRRHGAEIWTSSTELPVVLDQALTGVMVIFSLLDTEIHRITAGTSDPSRIRWRARLRMMWNESQLNDLLGSIRGQQTAISLLIQLLQMNTLNEVRNMLREQSDTVRASASITRSLRARNPNVRVASSIYDRPDHASSRAPFATDTASMAAPSELEFEFDDMVVNSHAYRRAMAHAQARTRPSGSQTQLTLDEVNARTDNLTITQADMASAAPPVLLQRLQDPALHESPARKQTIDDAGQLTDAAELAGKGLAAAEPEDTATTSLISPDKPRRSTTPTELVRGEHIMADGTERCAKCCRLLAGHSIAHIPAKDGTKLFPPGLLYLCSRTNQSLQDCAEPISHSFFPLDYMFFCETDYFRRLDLLCSACGGALRGSYAVTPEGRKFHPNHFGCETPGCCVVFGAEDVYYTHQSKHYCLYHYCHSYAHQCVSCTCPILDKFVEQDRPGEAGHMQLWWHRECYEINRFWGVQLKALANARLRRTEAGWRDKLGNPIGHADLARRVESITRDTKHIWSVVGEFEEAFAGHIKDTMTALSYSPLPDYSAFVRAVRAMLRCAAALLDAVQQVAKPGIGVREARRLRSSLAKTCSLACEVFLTRRRIHTLVQISPNNLQEDAHEIARLGAALASHAKQLVCIGLQACTNLQDDNTVQQQLRRFLQPLQDRETPSELVQSFEAQLDELPPATSGFPDQADRCMGCGKVVEGRCYSSSSPAEGGGLRFWHVACLCCEACGRSGAFEQGPDGPDMSGFGEWTMQCTSCGEEPAAPETYAWYSAHDREIVLLYLGLAMLIRFAWMARKLVPVR